MQETKEIMTQTNNLFIFVDKIGTTPAVTSQHNRWEGNLAQERFAFNGITDMVNNKSPQKAYIFGSISIVLLVVLEISVRWPQRRCMHAYVYREQTNAGDSHRSKRAQ